MRFSFLILLLSCASGQKKSVDWINQPQVDDKKICAVGEAANYTASDIKAKTALLGVFETKIDSFTSQSKDLSESGKISVKQGSSFSQEIKGAIQGATIEKRVEKSGNNYSLACIDKDFLASHLINEVKKQDTLLEEFAAVASAWNITKARNILGERNQIANSLEIVDSFVSSAPVDYDDINSWRNEADLKKKVYLHFSEEFPLGIKNSLNDQIHSLGIKIAPNILQANCYIKASYKLQKDHYKVRGFDQYRALVSLKGLNKNHIQQGSFSKEFPVIARSEEQVYEQIESKVKNYINDHLADLKL